MYRFILSLLLIGTGLLLLNLPGCRPLNRSDYPTQVIPPRMIGDETTAPGEAPEDGELEVL